MYNNLLIEVLKAELNDINHVELLEKCAATEKGQNYWSNMFRLKIKCVYLSKDNEKKEKIIHLISKEALTVGPMYQSLNNMDIFKTESVILSKILPQIEQLVGQKIGPNFFHYSDEPQMILMKDLCAEGFKNKDTTIGLTESQMLIVIKSLAMFHAGSVAINEKNPDYFKRFNLSIINEFTKEYFSNIMENPLRAMSQAIREWGDERSLKISDKLNKLAGNICQRLMNDAKYDDDEFCVLNHGDCWVNNMMFKDDENGEPLEVRLIDYQVTVWTSPALDLLSVLSGCPKLNIICDLDDYFIKEYLEILKPTMKKLNCKTVPPTIDSLKKSMLKRCTNAIMHGLIFQTKSIVESKDETAVDENLEMMSYLNVHHFNDPDVDKLLKKVIPIFDKRGYLD